MAHLDKYTRQELRRILRETYREYDDPTKYENDVDPARTKNNYNFNPDIRGSYDFLNRLDDRVADIIANEMDGKPPRNPPKFASWVITCPKELIGDLNGDDLQIRKFFTEVWDFCCRRYGKENVVDGVVHMDESTPHMTVYIIPECVSRKSGKHSISVATVFQRQELQGFHADLDKQCELTFGQKNLVTRSEEEKAENPYNKKMQDFKKDRLAEELFGTVFTEITEEAAEQAQLILQEAKSKADQIIKDARKKAEAFEEKRMEEAAEKIWTMNDRLGEMRKSAKKIFNDYADGKPLKEIADELNSQGIRTVNGALFNVENLRKILKNDKYTGLYHYDDIAIPGGMPQLVSQELYDKVQAQFALNKRGGRPATGDEEDEEPRYWLTGKLYCAKCKSPMHGVYGSGKSHRYYYYACNEQRKHKCSKKPVKKDWIESTVIDLLRMLLNKDDNALVLIENAIREYKKNSNDKAYLNSLEAELKEVQRKLDNMIKAIEDGVYTETTRSRLIELEERRDALDQAIMVEQAKNELFQDVGFGELYKRYLDADLDNPELRDELLDYFVDKIYIDDDGKLSFVLKLYDKDEVELQEVSEDEIFDFVGVEVFDNFGLCSTKL